MWELILCMHARLILQCLFLLFWKIFQPMAMLSLVLCALCNVKCIQQRCSFLQILLFYLNLATYLTLTSQHHFDLVYYLKMLSMITAIPLLPFFLSFTMVWHSVVSYQLYDWSPWHSSDQGITCECDSFWLQQINKTFQWTLLFSHQVL